MSRPFSAFRANARDHRAGILVAALSSAFGVALVGGVNVLGAYIGASSMGSTAACGWHWRSSPESSS
ncbi:hypothetical protein [Leifsonia xyli]|uniref:hypothetical protein n=1 Tax=Leifsonia xyli TaxID=1575 RepID=UPI003D67874A